MKNEPLNNLLKENSYELLSRCLGLVKHGLTLICRLYWRHEGWFRLEQIKNIIEKYYLVSDGSLHEMLSSLINRGFIFAANYQGNILYNVINDKTH